ncbi:hypothetical protein RRG08_049928 [Elysia crispata]|uniref:Uncharacterized protein n=1 Tax=Elysia crispata TaxID=231223 RepID=A0AAE1CPU0_9GAST|nr:hypothetical protein RRG08_049928 [Elysia crispata]
MNFSELLYDEEIQRIYGAVPRRDLTKIEKSRDKPGWQNKQEQREDETAHSPDDHTALDCSLFVTLTKMSRLRRELTEVQQQETPRTRLEIQTTCAHKNLGANSTSKHLSGHSDNRMSRDKQKQLETKADQLRGGRSWIWQEDGAVGGPSERQWRRQTSVRGSEYQVCRRQAIDRSAGRALRPTTTTLPPSNGGDGRGETRRQTTGSTGNMEDDKKKKKKNNNNNKRRKADTVSPRAAGWLSGDGVGFEAQDRKARRQLVANKVKIIGANHDRYLQKTNKPAVQNRHGYFR